MHTPEPALETGEPSRWPRRYWASRGLARLCPARADEARLLLAALPLRDRALYAAAFFAGLRLTELRAFMRVSSVRVSVVTSI